MRIERAYPEPNYVQCENEDGRYDVQSGYYVVAYCTDGFGNQVILTHATDLFLGEKDAQAFCDHVIGSEYVETAWNVASVSNPNDLPDYVTNWHLPEYN